MLCGARKRKASMTHLIENSTQDHVLYIALMFLMYVKWYSELFREAPHVILLSDVPVSYLTTCGHYKRTRSVLARTRTYSTLRGRSLFIFTPTTN